MKSAVEIYFFHTENCCMLYNIFICWNYFSLVLLWFKEIFDSLIFFLIIIYRFRFLVLVFGVCLFKVIILLLNTIKANTVHKNEPKWHNKHFFFCVKGNTKTFAGGWNCLYKLEVGFRIWPYLLYDPQCTMLQGNIQPEISPPTNMISASFICYQDKLFQMNERGISKLQYTLLSLKF